MADAITIPLSISEADVQRIAEAVARRLTSQRPHATVEETARELRIGVRTVHRHVASGRLRAVHVGRRVLVLRESIDALIQSRQP